MPERRTDLALEAKELWEESAGRTTKLPGVRAGTKRMGRCTVTKVDILDAEGEKALGKPRGQYLTVELGDLSAEGGFEGAVETVGRQLRKLLPPKGGILVAGLGNRAMTPDAVGPLAVEHLLVTRHLISSLPRYFGGFRAVSAVTPGVLGQSGVESAEAVAALVRELRPAAVIAVDALAARRTERLCTTVQLSDTGIAPGSGVGNHRKALSRETLGVPVIALGVPTVVDAATIAADLLEKSGGEEVTAEKLRRAALPMMVTPRDIDRSVRQLGKVAGYAINWALQDMDISEMSALLT